MLTYLSAYLAGALTLINPCVLPLLPITLAAALQGSRYGPLALAAGLTASFTLLGVGITAFGHVVGIDQEVVSRTAAVLMIIFGTVLLLPRAQAALALAAAPLANSASERIAQVQSAGLPGQVLIGALLGAVWSPCVGPTLGGAIGLAAAGESLVQATVTMLIFGFGVSTVLIALAYGSRGALSIRRDRLRALMPWAKPIMGAMLLLVGLMLFFHLDRHIDLWLQDNLPVWLLDLSVSV